MENSGKHHGKHSHVHGDHCKSGHSDEMVKDPVCGMTISASRAAAKMDYKGTTYYFCNPKCHSKFAANPEQYLEKSDVKVAQNLDKNKIYTCPMHPQIRQKGPGNCPICGMALEPEEISFENEENPELVDFTKRLKVSAVLTIPLALLAMSDLIPDQPIQHAIPLGSMPGYNSP